MGDAYKWPSNLWTLKLILLLTGKAQAAYSNMDRGKSKELQVKIKTAIVKRYNINDKTYQQSTQPEAKESFA